MNSSHTYRSLSKTYKSCLFGLLLGSHAYKTSVCRNHNVFLFLLLNGRVSILLLWQVYYNLVTSDKNVRGERGKFPPFRTMTSITWLRSWLSAFSTVMLLFYLPFHTDLLGRKAHLRSGELFLEWGQSSYINYLGFFCTGDLTFPHLFLQSFIAISYMLI